MEGGHCPAHILDVPGTPPVLTRSADKGSPSEELWHMILAQLCLRDIARCTLVNSKWHAHASSDALWRTVHDLYFAPTDSFPVVALPPPKLSGVQIEKGTDWRGKAFDYLREWKARCSTFDEALSWACERSLSCFVGHLFTNEMSSLCTLEYVRSCQC